MKKLVNWALKGISNTKDWALNKAKKAKSGTLKKINNIKAGVRGRFIKIEKDDPIEANIDNENFDGTASLRQHLGNEEFDNAIITVNDSQEKIDSSGSKIEKKVTKIKPKTKAKQKIDSSSAKVIDKLEAALPSFVVWKKSKDNKDLKKVVSFYNAIRKDVVQEKSSSYEINSPRDIKKFIFENKDKVFDIFIQYDKENLFNLYDKNITADELTEKLLWLVKLKHGTPTTDRLIESYQNDMWTLLKKANSKRSKNQQIRFEKREKSLAGFFNDVKSRSAGILFTWLKEEMNTLKNQVIKKEITEDFYCDIMLFLTKANISTWNNLKIDRKKQQEHLTDSYNFVKTIIEKSIEEEKHKGETLIKEMKLFNEKIKVDKKAKINVANQANEDKVDNKMQTLLKNELFWNYASKLNKKGLYNILNFYDDKWKSIAWFDKFLYAWEENKENAEGLINIINNLSEKSIEELKKILLKKPEKLLKFIEKNEIYSDKAIDKIEDKRNWLAGS